MIRTLTAAPFLATRATSTKPFRRICVARAPHLRQLSSTRRLNFDPDYDPPPTWTEIESQIERLKELFQPLEGQPLAQVCTNSKAAQAWHIYIAEALDLRERLMTSDVRPDKVNDFNKSHFLYLLDIQKDLDTLATTDDSQKGGGMAEILRRRGFRPGFTEEERRRHDELQLKAAFLVKEIEKRLGWFLTTWIRLKRSQNARNW